MTLVLGMLAVWGLVLLLEKLVEASEWIPVAFALLLGVGWQCLIDWDQWYLGVGVGGGALVLGRITDVLLVTADWIRVGVLRNSRPRSR